MWNERENLSYVELNWNRSESSANRQRSKTHACVSSCTYFVVCYTVLCCAIEPYHHQTISWFWPNVNGARIINWLCLRLPFTVSYQLMMFASTSASVYMKMDWRKFHHRFLVSFSLFPQFVVYMHTQTNKRAHIFSPFSCGAVYFPSVVCPFLLHAAFILRRHGKRLRRPTRWFSFTRNNIRAVQSEHLRLEQPTIYRE